jgi:hypothetical protein
MRAARLAAIVTAVLIAAATSTSSAAERTSFGLGVGALYNGLGVNIALVKADDLKYLSVGCSEASRSSIDGTNLTCGLGIGWLRSDILTRKNSKHGLGLNIAVDYDQLHSEAEPAVRMPYVFFFRGLDRKGWNLGVAPLVRWDTKGTEIGVMFEVGYQF